MAPVGRHQDACTDEEAGRAEASDSGKPEGRLVVIRLLRRGLPIDEQVLEDGAAEAKQKAAASSLDSGVQDTQGLEKKLFTGNKRDINAEWRDSASGKPCVCDHGFDRRACMIPRHTRPCRTMLMGRQRKKRRLPSRTAGV